jgi:NAD(P)-dependent dehydrogenase (short-subunit alcohol dehydrogenase family)
VGSVLITGATSGIGRALALAYASADRRLVLFGRDPARMEAVAALCRAKGARVETVLVDVQDGAGLRAAIEAADARDAIDLAIACAGITSGISPDRPFESPQAVRAILGINLLGVINTIDPLVPLMTARRTGHIAIIGSLAAFRGLPSSPAYSAAKAAVQAYGEGLRPTLARYGVTLSVVAPGFVETPLNRDIVAPRPLQVSAEVAARRIRRGLDRRQRLIAFPWPLYAGLRLLGLLPAGVGDRLLGRVRAFVPETHERSRD